MIYLDNAATTKINKKALKELNKWNKLFGNSESTYDIGRKAANKVLESRKIISDFIGCDANNLLFTSGGCEGNSWALISSICYLKQQNKPVNIAITGIEHHSVINVVDFAQTNFNANVSYIPINKKGYIKIKDLEEFLIKNNITLMSMVLVNNETGIYQDNITEIINITKKMGVITHIDAVQALPHFPLSSVVKSGCDFITVSAHKIGGPKGVGALYVKSVENLSPIIFGGVQEQGKRGGTINVGLIAAFAKAIELYTYREDVYEKYFKYIVKELIEPLDLKINGGVFGGRTYGIINIDCKMSTSEIVNYLDSKKVCVSTGSACNGSGSYSHVLEKIGAAPTNGLRISFGNETTFKDVIKFVKNFKKCYSMFLSLFPTGGECK